jgi:hypothetical protein
MQVKKSLKFALLDSNHLILHSQNNPLCQGHTETKKKTLTKSCWPMQMLVSWLMASNTMFTALVFQNNSNLRMRKAFKLEQPESNQLRTIYRQTPDKFFRLLSVFGSQLRQLKLF